MLFGVLSLSSIGVVSCCFVSGSNFKLMVMVMTSNDDVMQ